MSQPSVKMVKMMEKIQFLVLVTDCGRLLSQSRTVFLKNENKQHMLQGFSLQGVKQINSEPVLHHRLNMEISL